MNLFKYTWKVLQIQTISIGLKFDSSKCLQKEAVTHAQTGSAVAQMSDDQNRTQAKPASTPNLSNS